MELLIAVVNHPDKLDEIFSGFVELGITGATLLTSEGMGRVLAREVPILAGVAALSARTRAQNHTILSVMPPEKIESVIALLEEVCGDFSDPATGIVITVPVSRVIGLAPELGEDA